MTPVALINNYKIIFICAARHVGLTLAKYMISINKKIGFAFGCNDVDDIRLHNNAISEFDVIKKGNKVFKKPNHSNGEKVQIMICDVHSYNYAMLYMKSFHDKNDILLYWDEPTITLDYESHELHSSIQNVMKNNQISNVILSSATLPKLDKIQPFINSFCEKFETKQENIISITSDDFYNNITVYNSSGNIVIPHKLWLNDNDKLNSFIKYYSDNKVMQKYLDINSCIQFILDVNILVNSRIISRLFENEFKETSIFNISNKNITNIYIQLLSILSNSNKKNLYDHYNFKYNNNTSIIYYFKRCIHNYKWSMSIFI